MEIPRYYLDLFHRIRGAHRDIHHFAYYLEYMVFHLPREKLLPATQWLLRNNLTEQRFIDLIKNECHSSGLEFIRYLTMKLERESQTRALSRRDVQ